MILRPLLPGRRDHRRQTRSEHSSGRAFSSALVFAAGLALAAPAAAQTYWLGADLSYANEMNDCGAVYRDGGEPKEVYQLFADKGANLVRLRLWHSPEWTSYSTLADVKRSIVRAKAAGMAVLLDFHYSDDWADPGDQIIPKAWRGLGEEELAEAVYEYTLSVLLELDAEGLMPDMVQVGNETNTEILLTEKVAEDKAIDWARNVRLFDAGILAVREAGRVGSKAPSVMLHIAQPENVEPWFDSAVAAGIADFDYIGVSYYPKWSTRSMTDLGRTIRRLRHKFGKEVIVVETAYPWTLEGADKAGNILGEDSVVADYPASLDGQKQFLVDLAQTVIANEGVGVVYWEPAWVAAGCKTRWGDGSNWENSAFFDYRSTDAHSGFDFFSHSYAKPVTTTLRFKPSAGHAKGPIYLWADFFENNTFLKRLEPQNGAYEYEVRLTPGEEYRLQVYESPSLGRGLLAGADVTADGMVAATAGVEPKVVFDVDLKK